MQTIFAVAIGGSVGAVARYGISLYVAQATGGTFPWGTLAVNLLGSFLLGVLAESLESMIAPAMWRHLLGIGLLGAFTTFSTFAFESYYLFRDGEMRLAIVNMFANNVGGIVLLMTGMFLVRMLMRAPS